MGDKKKIVLQIFFYLKKALKKTSEFEKNISFNFETIITIFINKFIFVIYIFINSYFNEQKMKLILIFIIFIQGLFLLGGCLGF